MPTRPTTHAVRRNRSASTYSGPSGHAATMSTSDPNSTAIPRIDSTRPSQIDPLDTPSASLSLLDELEAVVVAEAAAAESPVAVAVGSTVKPKLPRSSAAPSASVVV